MFTVGAIESDNQARQSASVGETVGLLLRGESLDRVQRGQILAGATATYNTNLVTFQNNVQTALNNLFGDERQRITFTGGPTGGTFNLTWAGTTVSGIGYATTPIPNPSSFATEQKTTLYYSDGKTVLASLGNTTQGRQTAVCNEARSFDARRLVHPGSTA